MSIRQKEFEKALQKARSEKDIELRLRKLGDTYIRYLKYANGMYSKSAMKSIEKSIIKKYKGQEIPPQLHKLILEASKYYSRTGNYEVAMSVLDEIIDSRNVSIMMQAQYESDMIKLKQRLEQGSVDTSIIDEIKDIVKDDEDHELETATAGEFLDYDIFCSYFGDKIPISSLSEEIFPVNMEKPKNPRIQPDIIIPGSRPSPHAPSSYIEELSANNRLKYLVENFDIAYGRPGGGKFTGAILFEIEDSDLVIVENFWRQGKDGEPPVEDYGKATYILPKDQAMDLIQLSRGEIKAKNDPRIRTVNHGSKEYYNNLVDRFNEAQSSQLKRIEQRTNPLKNVTREEQSTEDISIDTIELSEETSDLGQKEQASKDSALEITNEDFLNMINQNLGDIITPDIMNGLLKRASYSFQNLYEGKLREDIVDRLKILEVPDEDLEIEAQKVFLYIRMAKNISMINSGAIKGENLSNILDDSVIEYDKTIKFFEKHISEGLTYNEMKKAIKQFVQTGRDPFEQEEILQGTNEDVVIEDPQSTIVPTELDNINEQPQQGDEQGDDILGTLLGGEVSKETKTKALDIVTRYLELLKRNEELELETERINKQLAEKKKQYELRQQATIEAQEHEKQARLATQVAMQQEELSSQELQVAQQEKEQLDREQQELKEKIAKIEDLLRE